MSEVKKSKKWLFEVAGALLWTLASVIASQLVVGCIMLSIVGAEGFGQPVVTAVYSAISYTLALILVLVVPSKFERKNKAKKDELTEAEKKKLKKAKWQSLRKRLGLEGLLTWKDLGLAPVGYAVYLLLAAGITALFMLFPWFNAEQVQDVGFSRFIAGGDKIIAFVTLVIIAPVAEEIIFRGWLYDRLRKAFSEQLSEKLGMTLSIFLVSLLFGIVHLQWNVGVNVFAMSIVLCGLREITGTIYSGIVLHILKNGIAFYILYGININF